MCCWKSKISRTPHSRSEDLAAKAYAVAALWISTEPMVSVSRRMEGGVADLSESVWVRERKREGEQAKKVAHMFCSTKTHANIYMHIYDISHPACTTPVKDDGKAVRVLPLPGMPMIKDLGTSGYEFATSGWVISHVICYRCVVRQCRFFFPFYSRGFQSSKCTHYTHAYKRTLIYSGWSNQLFQATQEHISVSHSRPEEAQGGRILTICLWTKTTGR